MQKLRNITVILIIGLFPTVGTTQIDYNIETTDITNFWKAFDLLESSKTKEDSINIIQRHYIDKSTKYFQEFIKARNFTALEYVEKINLYPKFWNSIRPLTEDISNRKKEIEKIFIDYKKLIPNFKQPNVCFAIGCLRTGGTTTKGLILIGSEIAASNYEIDKSEMTGWLANIIGNSGDIISIVAHEAIHTQQFDSRLITIGKNKLLEQVMKEGIADFFTLELLGLNINKKIFEYGEKHECDLKREFKYDLKNYPKKYKRWLYQGTKSKKRPADLGYYIGYKIAKMYFEKSDNKQKVLKDFLNVKKYKKIFRRSKYLKESCG